MRLNYKITNVCGTVYKKGNLIFSSDGYLLYSPIGNQVSVFNLKNNESFTVITKNKSDINIIELCPKSNLLFSVDENNCCIVSNVAKRVKLHYIRFKDKVRDLKVSKDEKYFAVTVANRVELYELPSFNIKFMPFNKKRSILGFSSHVTCLNWSSTNKFLIAGSDDCSVRIIDLNNIDVPKIKLFTAHKTSIVNVYFAENFNFISISRDGTVLNWTCNSDDPLTLNEGLEWTYERHYCSKEYGDVSCSTYNPKRNFLIIGFKKGVFSIYELPEFNVVQTLSATDNKISSIIVNESCEWIGLSSKLNGQLIVWEWCSESYIMKQQGYFYDYNKANLSNDGVLMVTGDSNNKVKIWDTNSCLCLMTFNEHTNSITDVAFSSNNQFVITSSNDGTLRAFDLLRYRNFRCFVTDKQVQFSCLAIDSSSELVCAGSTDTFEIFLWSVASGQLLDIIYGHEGPVCCMKFIADSTKIITGSWDKNGRICNVLEHTSSSNFLNLYSEVITLAIDSLGKMVGFATINGNITFWDMVSETHSGYIETTRDLGLSHKSSDTIIPERSLTSRHITTLSFSIDGKHILAGGQSKFICLYDVKSQVLLKRFEISHNYSLDGLSARLCKKRKKEQVSDGYSNEESDNDGASMKMPGQKHPDMSLRDLKPEIACRHVEFSPTGRGFVTITTEGLLIYKLDDDNLFNSFDISIDVSTIKYHEMIKQKDYGQALLCAIKLNELKLIKDVLMYFSIDQIDPISKALNISHAHRFIHHLCSLINSIKNCPNIEFLLYWINSLLSNHVLQFRNQNNHNRVLSVYKNNLENKEQDASSGDVHISSANISNNIKELMAEIKNALNLFEDAIVPLCESNLSTLEFIISQIKIDKKTEKTIEEISDLFL